MYHAVVRSPLGVYDWCFVDESSFCRQIEYLKRRFKVMPLSEAIEQLKQGAIDRPTAVLTFDDGFQNNFDVVFPILREAGLPATIFPVTGLVNTDDTLWYCRLNYAIATTRIRWLDWNDAHFNLGDSQAKASANATLQAQLKAFPQAQLLAELQEIILKLDGDPDCHFDPDSPYRMLSQEAIQRMAASGLIEFGAHTHTHAILTLLSLEDRHREIEQSVNAVSQLTGRTCHLFAYPNGRPQDYDLEIITMLESYGIQTAVTTTSGPNEKVTPTMELKRYGVGGNLSAAKSKIFIEKILSD